MKLREEWVAIIPTTGAVEEHVFTTCDEAYGQARRFDPVATPQTSVRRRVYHPGSEACTTSDDDRPVCGIYIGAPWQRLRAERDAALARAEKAEALADEWRTLAHKLEREAPVHADTLRLAKDVFAELESVRSVLACDDDPIAETLTDKAVRLMAALDMAEETVAEWNAAAKESETVPEVRTERECVPGRHGSLCAYPNDREPALRIEVECLRDLASAANLVLSAPEINLSWPFAKDTRDRLRAYLAAPPSIVEVLGAERKQTIAAAPATKVEPGELSLDVEAVILKARGDALDEAIAACIAVADRTHDKAEASGAHHCRRAICRLPVKAVST